MSTLENVHVRKPNGDAVCYAVHAIQDLDRGSVRLTEGVTVYIPLKTDETYRLETGDGELDLRYTGTGPHGHPTFEVQ